MITSITRDDRAASNLISSQGVNRTGMYVGVITQAEIAESASGATYIELAFRAKEWIQKDAEGNCHEGRAVDARAAQDGPLVFLRTYITNKAGEKAFGHAIIDALMVVLDITNLQPVEATVFDRTYAKDKATHKGYRFPELEKKLVGLLLQRENDTFTTSEGEVKETYRMNIVTPYDPNTRQCAKEILEGNDARLVGERFAVIKDRQAKPRTQTAAPAPAAYQPATVTAADLAATADDVPF